MFISETSVEDLSPSVQLLFWAWCPSDRSVQETDAEAAYRGSVATYMIYRLAETANCCCCYSNCCRCYHNRLAKQRRSWTRVTEHPQQVKSNYLRMDRHFANLYKKICEDRMKKHYIVRVLRSRLVNVKTKIKTLFKCITAYNVKEFCTLLCHGQGQQRESLSDIFISAHASFDISQDRQANNCATTRHKLSEIRYLRCPLYSLNELHRVAEKVGHIFMFAITSAKVDQFS